MKRAVAAASLCLSCGARTGLDVPHHDAGSSPTCDWQTPFGSVTPLAELNAPGGDAELRLSQDELTGYFYRLSGAGGGDIFEAHRSSLDSAFGAATLATDLSSGSYEADPFVSTDGLSMYVNTNRSGALGSSDIFVAHRASTSAPFEALQPVANVNSTSYDGTPFVTNDGSELWLASHRNGSNDLFRAHAMAGGFGPAETVSELDSSNDEENPVLSADGLTVYFSSNRNLGGTRIFAAHRDALSAQFSAPKLVPEISTTGADYPSWISADGCRLYVTRGSSSSFALFVAVR